jgi:alpha-glucosidase
MRIRGRSSWRSDRGVFVGERIARFRDPAHAAIPLAPFPAYIAPLVERGRAPASLRSRPTFTDRDGLRHAFIAIEPGTDLYGTGEIAGPLRRNGRVSVCWNTDCFDYTDRSASLYQSHPFVLAVRRDGSALGVICETTHRCRIDLRRGILFSCEGYSPAVTVIERDSPMEVVTVLADLTGKMPMPPIWALGYHQCRWSYEPEWRVREIASAFRERGIPCDVLWLDIDYMDRFRCFTFDHGKFPDPAALTADLRSRGFHSVWMIDPGISTDDGYRVHEWGRPHFIRDARGDEFRGKVWPESCAFPDFTNADVRAWWAGLYGEFLSHGIDGVWNDMNEPAIFDGPGKSIPLTCRHEADADLGGPGDHARYHNLYGMQMVRASREGMAAARPGERVFILTRSNFLGGQRYAATWTGDNRSDWNHLRWSIPMCLNLSVSGQPMVGPDIGGFVGDATPFMGIGSLLPFARGHSIKGSRDHEPWSFGEACERACRLALERRYRLLPYLYRCVREAATTGEPIARPVFFADARDRRLRGIDDAFLLGGDVMVSASVNAEGGSEPKAVLEGWREFEIAGVPGSDDRADARDEHGEARFRHETDTSGRPMRAHRSLPRLFIRPGAVVPIAPACRHTGEIDWSSLTLLIAPDGSGRAIGRVYRDDGRSLAFEHGEFAEHEFVAEVSSTGRTVRTAMVGGRGEFPIGVAAHRWID